MISVKKVRLLFILFLCSNILTLFSGKYAVLSNKALPAALQSKQSKCLLL